MSEEGIQLWAWMGRGVYKHWMYLKVNDRYWSMFMDDLDATPIFGKAPGFETAKRVNPDGKAHSEVLTMLAYIVIACAGVKTDGSA